VIGTLSLDPSDLVVLGVYFCIPLGIGLALRRRGSRDTASFLLSGRSLPWWLAGTSMAADTFASDTPLYVAALVRRDGVAGNWQWWCFAFSGVLAVFLLAPLWRRTEATTDLEVVEMRYGGKPAAFLRGFKAFLLAVPFNCLLVGGMPLLAMVKVLQVTAGMDPGDAHAGEATAKALAIAVSLGVVLAYTTVSGLWAVVVNDLVLLALALAGAVTLSCYAVGAVGGLGALRERVLAHDGGSAWRTDFLPSGGDGPGLALGVFLVFVGFQWWAHRTADGGGVVVQRMLACRNEKHAVGATLWFNVLNYAIRTWPWVLTGLALVLLYPETRDAEAAYPMAMRDLLPAGVRGFVLASMFAAFMSTADTQLHWGASYLVNDLYRRFLRRDAPEAHYVAASRLSMGLMVLGTALVAFLATSVESVFGFLLTFFAGTGTVFLGRWLWWRVNAWSEIAAVAAAPLASLAVKALAGEGGPLAGVPVAYHLVIVAGFTTVAWVVATFATAPVPLERLAAFYRKTLPPGFWGPVRAAFPDLPTPPPVGRALLRWAAGLALVLGATLGIGKALLGTPGEAALALAAASAGGMFLWRDLGRAGRGPAAAA